MAKGLQQSPAPAGLDTRQSEFRVLSSLWKQTLTSSNLLIHPEYRRTPEPSWKITLESVLINSIPAQAYIVHCWQLLLQRRLRRTDYVLFQKYEAIIKVFTAVFQDRVQRGCVQKVQVRRFAWALDLVLTTILHTKQSLRYILLSPCVIAIVKIINFS